MVMLTPVLSPHGALMLARSLEADAAPALDLARAVRLEQAFARGSGHGLLVLGADEVGTVLPPTLSFWRKFGARYVTALCSLPGIGERSKPLVPIPADVRLADGSEIEADIVVGADGIHSVVRRSLFGADAPRFTGCVCWRGMARAAVVPRDIAIAQGSMWMGPHGHVVHYPVRRGELINIVAHFDSDGWVEESWTRECDLSEVTTTYAGWHPDLLRLYPYSDR